MKNLKIQKMIFTLANSICRNLSILNIFSFTIILIAVIMMVSCTTSKNTSAELIRTEASSSNQNMYVIEREIPGAGNLTAEDLKGISQVSCNVLDSLGSEIQWLHSYVTGDKVYCVYTAANVKLVEEHAQKGGFPANKISKVENVIDPSTAK